MRSNLVSQNEISKFQKDGVILIRNLFSDFVETICAGIEKNLATPGEYAAENLKLNESGRFFDDYCNWQRIDEYKDAIFNSNAGRVASELMNSKRVQLFHEHILVKEPGTAKETPWHQDSPYYFIEGRQTVSFWTPMEPVTSATLRCVAGSHKWKKPVLPIKWLNEDTFYQNNTGFRPVPKPDSDQMNIKEWKLNPGDAVAFDFKTLHGARGNKSEKRRRAFSLRLIGDDARYIERPGRTSPPFPNHGMVPGQILREDWFPIIFEK